MRTGLSSKALKQIVAGTVAGVFFFTTVSEPYAQTSFWAERQAARQAFTNPSPNARPLLSSIQWPKDSLNPVLGSYRLPSKIGSVVETHEAGPNAPVLIHIQDAHGVYGAQYNASLILDGLSKSGWIAGALPVYQEGGAGPANIDWLSAFPFEDIKESVARAHLRKGDLTGEEYRALASSSGTFRLVGAETEELYKKNLAARHDTAKARAAADIHIAALQARLKTLKKRLYPATLLALDEPQQAYEEQRISFVEYVQKMEALFPASLRPADYPNLDALLRLTGMESDLDIRALAEEREMLVRKLSGHLSEETVKDLISQAVAVREGRLTQRAFYQALLNTADQLKRTGEDMPTKELRRYVGYLALSETLRHDALLSEAEQLRSRLAERFASNDRVWRLMNTDRRVALERLLWKHEMTPDQYTIFKQEGPLDWPEVERYILAQESALNISASSNKLRLKMVSLPPRGGGSGRGGIVTNEDELHPPSSPSPARGEGKTPSPDLSWTASLPQVRAYYELALERDIALVQNALADMERAGAKRAVLIAGGFHTPGLTRALRQAGAAYAVLQPGFEAEGPTRHELLISQEPGAFSHSVREMLNAVFNERQPALPLAFNLLGRITIERFAKAIEGMVQPGNKEAKSIENELLSFARFLEKIGIKLRVYNAKVLLKNGNTQLVIYGQYGNELFFIAQSQDANEMFFVSESYVQGDSKSINAKLGELRSYDSGSLPRALSAFADAILKKPILNAQEMEIWRTKTLQNLQSIAEAAQTPSTELSARGHEIVQSTETAIQASAQNVGPRLLASFRAVAKWLKNHRWGVGAGFMAFTAGAQASVGATQNLSFLDAVLPGVGLVLAILLGGAAILAFKAKRKPAMAADGQETASPPETAPSPGRGINWWVPLLISGGLLLALSYTGLPLLVEFAHAAAASAGLMAAPLKLLAFGTAFMSGVVLVLGMVAIGGRALIDSRWGKTTAGLKVVGFFTPKQENSDLPPAQQFKQSWQKNVDAFKTTVQAGPAAWPGAIFGLGIHLVKDLWGTIYGFAFQQVDHLYMIASGKGLRGPPSMTEEVFINFVGRLEKSGTRPVLRNLAVFLAMPLFATSGMLGRRLALLFYSTLAQMALMTVLGGIFTLVSADPSGLLSLAVNANLLDIVMGEGWAMTIAQQGGVASAAVQLASPFAMASSFLLAMVLTVKDQARKIQMSDKEKFAASGFLKRHLGWAAYLPLMPAARSALAKSQGRSPYSLPDMLILSFRKAFAPNGLHFVGLEVALLVALASAPWVPGPIHDLVMKIEGDPNNPDQIAVLPAGQHVMEAVGIDTQNVSIPFVGKTVREIHEIQALKYQAQRVEAGLESARNAEAALPSGEQKEDAQNRVQAYEFLANNFQQSLAEREEKPLMSITDIINPPTVLPPVAPVIETIISTLDGDTPPSEIPEDDVAALPVFIPAEPAQAPVETDVPKVPPSVAPAPSPVPDSPGPGVYQVNTKLDPLRVRSGPGDMSDGSKIGRVTKGAAVTVREWVQDEGGKPWAKIDWRGMTGWVAGEFLTPAGSPVETSPAASPVGQIEELNRAPGYVDTPSGVKIRIGPGTSFDSIGRVPDGRGVIQIAQTADGAWVMVKYGGLEGWISAAYVKPGEPPARAPARAEPRTRGERTSEPREPPPAPADGGSEFQVRTGWETLRVPRDVTKVTLHANADSTLKVDIRLDGKRAIRIEGVAGPDINLPLESLKRIHQGRPLTLTRGIPEKLARLSPGTYRVIAPKDWTEGDLRRYLSSADLVASEEPGKPTSAPAPSAERETERKGPPSADSKTKATNRRYDPDDPLDWIQMQRESTPARAEAETADVPAYRWNSASGALTAEDLMGLSRQATQVVLGDLKAQKASLLREIAETRWRGSLTIGPNGLFPEINFSDSSTEASTQEAAVWGEVAARIQTEFVAASVQYQAIQLALDLRNLRVQLDHHEAVADRLKRALSAMEEKVGQDIQNADSHSRVLTVMEEENLAIETIRSQIYDQSNVLGNLLRLPPTVNVQELAIRLGDDAGLAALRKAGGDQLSKARVQLAEARVQQALAAIEPVYRTKITGTAVVSFLAQAAVAAATGGAIAPGLLVQLVFDEGVKDDQGLERVRGQVHAYAQALAEHQSILMEEKTEREKGLVIQAHAMDRVAAFKAMLGRTRGDLDKIEREFLEGKSRSSAVYLGVLGEHIRTGNDYAKNLREWERHKVNEASRGAAYQPVHQRLTAQDADRLDDMDVSEAAGLALGFPARIARSILGQDADGEIKKLREQLEKRMAGLKEPARLMSNDLADLDALARARNPQVEAARQRVALAKQNLQEELAADKMKWAWMFGVTLSGESDNLSEISLGVRPGFRAEWTGFDPARAEKLRVQELGVQMAELDLKVAEQESRDRLVKHLIDRDEAKEKISIIRVHEDIKAKELENINKLEALNRDQFAQRAEAENKLAILRMEREDMENYIEILRMEINRELGAGAIAGLNFSLSDKTTSKDLDRQLADLRYSEYTVGNAVTARGQKVLGELAQALDMAGPLLQDLRSDPAKTEKDARLLNSLQEQIAMLRQLLARPVAKDFKYFSDLSDAAAQALFLSASLSPHLTLRTEAGVRLTHLMEAADTDLQGRFDPRAHEQLAMKKAQIHQARAVAAGSREALTLNLQFSVALGTENFTGDLATATLASFLSGVIPREFVAALFTPFHAAFEALVPEEARDEGLPLLLGNLIPGYRLMSEKERRAKLEMVQAAKELVIAEQRNKELILLREATEAFYVEGVRALDRMKLFRDDLTLPEYGPMAELGRISQALQAREVRVEIDRKILLLETDMRKVAAALRFLGRDPSRLERKSTGRETVDVRLLDPEKGGSDGGFMAALRPLAEEVSRQAAAVTRAERGLGGSGNVAAGAWPMFTFSLLNEDTATAGQVEAADLRLEAAKDETRLALGAESTRFAAQIARLISSLGEVENYSEATLDYQKLSTLTRIGKQEPKDFIQVEAAVIDSFSKATDRARAAAIAAITDLLSTLGRTDVDVRVEGMDQLREIAGVLTVDLLATLEADRRGPLREGLSEKQHEKLAQASQRLAEDRRSPAALLEGVSFQIAPRTKAGTGPVFHVRLFGGDQEDTAKIRELESWMERTLAGEARDRDVRFATQYTAELQTAMKNLAKVKEEIQRLGAPDVMKKLNEAYFQNHISIGDYWIHRDRITALKTQELFYEVTAALKYEALRQTLRTFDVEIPSLREQFQKSGIRLETRDVQAFLKSHIDSLEQDTFQSVPAVPQEWVEVERLLRKHPPAGPVSPAGAVEPVPMVPYSASPTLDEPEGKALPGHVEFEGPDSVERLTTNFLNKHKIFATDNHLLNGDDWSHYVLEVVKAHAPRNMNSLQLVDRVRQYLEILDPLFVEFKDMIRPEDMPNLLATTVNPIRDGLFPHYTRVMADRELGDRSNQNIEKLMGLAAIYQVEWNNPAMREGWRRNGFSTQEAWLKNMLRKDAAGVRASLAERQGLLSGQMEELRNNMKFHEFLADRVATTSLAHLPPEEADRYRTAIRESLNVHLPAFQMLNQLLMEGDLKDYRFTEYGDLHTESLYNSFTAIAVGEGMGPKEASAFIKLLAESFMEPAGKLVESVGLREIAQLPESHRLRYFLHRRMATNEEANDPRLPMEERVRNAREAKALDLLVKLELQLEKQKLVLSTSLYWAMELARQKGVGVKDLLDTNTRNGLFDLFKDYTEKVVALKEMPEVESIVRRQLRIGEDDPVNWLEAEAQGILSALALDWKREKWEREDVVAHARNFLHVADNLLSKLDEYFKAQGRPSPVKDLENKNDLLRHKAWAEVAAFVGTIEKLHKTPRLDESELESTMDDLILIEQGFREARSMLFAKAERLEKDAERDGESASRLRAEAAHYRREARELELSVGQAGYLFRLGRGLLPEEPPLLQGPDRAATLREMIANTIVAKTRYLEAGALVANQLRGYEGNPETRPGWLNQEDIEKMLLYLEGDGKTPGLRDTEVTLSAAVSHATKYMPSRSYTAADVLRESADELLLQTVYMRSHQDENGDPENVERGKLAPFLDAARTGSRSLDQNARILFFDGLARRSMKDLPARIAENLKQDGSGQSQEQISPHLFQLSETQYIGLATRLMWLQDHGEIPLAQDAVPVYLDDWINDAAFLQAELWKASGGNWILPYLLLNAAMEAFRDRELRLNETSKENFIKRIATRFSVDLGLRDLHEQNLLRSLLTSHYVVFKEVPNGAEEAEWLNRWRTLADRMTGRPQREVQAAQYELLVQAMILRQSFERLYAQELYRKNALDPEALDQLRARVEKDAIDALINNLVEADQRKEKIKTLAASAKDERAIIRPLRDLAAGDRDERARGNQLLLDGQPSDLVVLFPWIRDHLVDPMLWSFVKDLFWDGYTSGEIEQRFFTIPKRVREIIEEVRGEPVDMEDDRQKGLVSSLADDIFTSWGFLLAPENAELRAKAEVSLKQSDGIGVPKSVDEAMDQAFRRLRERLALELQVRAQVENYKQVFHADKERDEARRLSESMRISQDALSAAVSDEDIGDLYKTASLLRSMGKELGIDNADLAARALYEADLTLGLGVVEFVDTTRIDPRRLGVDMEVRSPAEALEARGKARENLRESVGRELNWMFHQEPRKTLAETMLPTAALEAVPENLRWLLQFPSLELTLLNKTNGEASFKKDALDRIADQMLERGIEPAELALLKTKMEELKALISQVQKEEEEKGLFDLPSGAVYGLTDLTLLLMVDEQRTKPIGIMGILFPELDPTSAEHKTPEARKEAGREGQRFVRKTGQPLSASSREIINARLREVVPEPEKLAFNRFLLGEFPLLPTDSFFRNIPLAAAMLPFLVFAFSLVLRPLGRLVDKAAPTLARFRLIWALHAVVTFTWEFMVRTFNLEELHEMRDEFRHWLKKEGKNVRWYSPHILFRFKIPIFSFLGAFWALFFVFWNVAVLAPYAATLSIPAAFVFFLFTAKAIQIFPKLTILLTIAYQKAFLIILGEGLLGLGLWDIWTGSGLLYGLLSGAVAFLNANYVFWFILGLHVLLLILTSAWMSRALGESPGYIVDRELFDEVAAQLPERDPTMPLAVNVNRLDPDRFLRIGYTLKEAHRLELERLESLKIPERQAEKILEEKAKGNFTDLADLEKRVGPIQSPYKDRIIFQKGQVPRDAQPVDLLTHLDQDQFDLVASPWLPELELPDTFIEYFRTEIAQMMAFTLRGNNDRRQIVSMHINGLFLKGIDDLQNKAQKIFNIGMGASVSEVADLLFAMSDDPGEAAVLLDDRGIRGELRYSLLAVIAGRDPISGVNGLRQDLQAIQNTVRGGLEESVAFRFLVNPGQVTKLKGDDYQRIKDFIKERNFKPVSFAFAKIPYSVGTDGRAIPLTPGRFIRAVSEISADFAEEFDYFDDSGMFHPGSERFMLIVGAGNRPPNLQSVLNRALIWGENGTPGSYFGENEYRHKLATGEWREEDFQSQVIDMSGRPVRVGLPHLTEREHRAALQPIQTQLENLLSPVFGSSEGPALARQITGLPADPNGAISEGQDAAAVLLKKYVLMKYPNDEKEEQEKILRLMISDYRKNSSRAKRHLAANNVDIQLISQAEEITSRMEIDFTPAYMRSKFLYGAIIPGKGFQNWDTAIGEGGGLSHIAPRKVGDPRVMGEIKIDNGNYTTPQSLLYGSKVAHKYRNEFGLFQGKSGSYFPFEGARAPTIWGWMGDLAQQEQLWFTQVGWSKLLDFTRSGGKYNGNSLVIDERYGPKPGFPYGFYHSMGWLYSGIVLHWMSDYSKHIRSQSDFNSGIMGKYVMGGFNSEDERMSAIMDDVLVLWTWVQNGRQGRIPMNPVFIRELEPLLAQMAQYPIPPSRNLSTGLVERPDGKALIADDRPATYAFEWWRLTKKWLTTFDFVQTWLRHRGRSVAQGPRAGTLNDLVDSGLFSEVTFLFLLVQGFLYTAVLSGAIEVELAKGAWALTSTFYALLVHSKFTGPVLQMIQKQNSFWASVAIAPVAILVGVVYFFFLSVTEIALSTTIYVGMIIPKVKAVLWDGILFLKRFRKYTTGGGWAINWRDIHTQPVGEYVRMNALGVTFASGLIVIIYGLGELAGLPTGTLTWAGFVIGGLIAALSLTQKDFWQYIDKLRATRKGFKGASNIGMGHFLAKKQYQWAIAEVVVLTTIYILLPVVGLTTLGWAEGAFALHEAIPRDWLFLGSTVLFAMLAMPFSAFLAGMQWRGDKLQRGIGPFLWGVGVIIVLLTLLVHAPALQFVFGPTIEAMAKVPLAVASGTMGADSVLGLFSPLLGVEAPHVAFNTLLIIGMALSMGLGLLAWAGWIIIIVLKQTIRGGWNGLRGSPSSSVAQRFFRWAPQVILAAAIFLFPWMELAGSSPQANLQPAGAMLTTPVLPSQQNVPSALTEPASPERTQPIARPFSLLQAFGAMVAFGILAAMGIGVAVAGVPGVGEVAEAGLRVLSGLAGIAMGWGAARFGWDLAAGAMGGVLAGRWASSWNPAESYTVADDVKQLMGRWGLVPGQVELVQRLPSGRSWRLAETRAATGEVFLLWWLARPWSRGDWLRQNLARTVLATEVWRLRLNDRMGGGLLLVALKPFLSPPPQRTLDRYQAFLKAEIARDNQARAKARLSLLEDHIAAEGKNAGEGESGRLNVLQMRVAEALRVMGDVGRALTALGAHFLERFGKLVFAGLLVAGLAVAVWTGAGGAAIAGAKALLPRIIVMALGVLLLGAAGMAKSDPLASFWKFPEGLRRAFDRFGAIISRPIESMEGTALVVSLPNGDLSDGVGKVLFEMLKRIEGRTDQTGVLPLVLKVSDTPVIDQATKDRYETALRALLSDLGLSEAMVARLSIDVIGGNAGSVRAYLQTNLTEKRFNVNVVAPAEEAEFWKTVGLPLAILLVSVLKDLSMFNVEVVLTGESVSLLEASGIQLPAEMKTKDGGARFKKLDATAPLEVLGEETRKIQLFNQQA